MPGKLKELQTLLSWVSILQFLVMSRNGGSRSLPDGSLSGESSLAGRISVVMSWTLMVSYSSIAASVNLVTTSSNDFYHDLVWYHDTTVVDCS